jgi:stearoyl-CoA desaturase (delta-9 desaturase)
MLILGVPLVAVVITQVTVIATSIYLHRALAHRSLRVHPVMDIAFRLLLWITTGQRRRQWVAVHRKHHTFTDRPGDPHSPRLLGFWRVQFLNVYYYVREARNPETQRVFAPDIAEDWLDRALLSRGWALGLVGGLAAGLLHAVLYVFVVAPLINGLGHWRGAQNFKNTAYNSSILAWVTGGESLHNNHHAHPRAPRFSMRRFEFDPSWLFIRAFAAIRLIAIVDAPMRLP